MEQHQLRLNQKNTKMKKNKINLKKTFLELENILNQLESSDIDIDEMVLLYEKGMKLTKNCKKKLEQAEQKITILNKSID